MNNGDSGDNPKLRPLIDRRTFIKGTAGAAGALWLASCAGNGGTGGLTGSPVPPSDVSKPLSKLVRALDI